MEATVRNPGIVVISGASAAAIGGLGALAWRRRLK
jgi:hypothetical protein